MSWLCVDENSSASRISRRKTRLALFVRHFDSDHGLARHRRLDSHRGRSQSHREIVGEIHDLADLDSGARLEFVHRDDRAGLHLDHAALDAEVRELLLEHARAALELTFVDLRMLGRRQIEQRLRRKFERALLPRLRRRRLVALLANIEQPDLERRRFAVDAVRHRSRLRRPRSARTELAQSSLRVRTRHGATRSNLGGNSREQLGRRPLEHQRKPADESERDAIKPPATLIESLS